MTVHPDRLLPADPATRRVARDLYATVAAAPIFSPHGHVDAGLLAADQPFTDAASLLVTPDHYVTRVLHSVGVGLAELGLGPHAAAPAGPRAVWRRFAEHWHAFLGTPTRLWLESELTDILGVTTPLTPGTADAVFDEVGERLAEPAFRPRALFRRFGIETLATTDDPAADLAAHRALADDPGFAGAVLPTFRPDAYLDPALPGFAAAAERLGAAAGIGTGSYDGYLDALRERRRHFAEHGATATDHGPPDPGSAPLPPADAARLYRRALAGGLDERDAAAFRRSMLFEMARMSTEDGLVMQLHPGVLRNHHRPTLRAFGPDTGHDLPLVTTYAEHLRPLLEAFGTHPRFRLVLFTVDEASFSRDIAPLAGFYPSVYIGSPWWFLDAPEAMLRWRAATVETAGFYKSAGFVDDTRAFCSIPARHDLARRVDAAYLARLVVEHRIAEDDAARVLHDLVVTLPRRVFARS